MQDIGQLIDALAAKDGPKHSADIDANLCEIIASLRDFDFEVTASCEGTRNPESPRSGQKAFIDFAGELPRKIAGRRAKTLGLLVEPIGILEERTGTRVSPLYDRAENFIQHNRDFPAKINALFRLNLPAYPNIKPKRKNKELPSCATDTDTLLMFQQAE